LQLTRLDFREIENVIQHREQRFRAVADRLGKIPLLRVQMGVEEDIAHPDDAIHRGADLMRHIGEELAFGLIGLFRFNDSSAKLIIAFVELGVAFIQLCIAFIQLAGAGCHQVFEQRILALGASQRPLNGQKGYSQQ